MVIRSTEDYRALFQAMEVIKLVCGIGEPLIGRLLMVDSLAMRFETVRYRRRKTD